MDDTFWLNYNGGVWSSASGFELVFLDQSYKSVDSSFYFGPTVFNRIPVNLKSSNRLNYFKTKPNAGWECFLHSIFENLER